MMINKYLVLHSGDRIYMSTHNVLCIKQSTQYFNDTLSGQIVLYEKSIRDSASHIELIPEHKDR
jgi:hypothetical protein